MWIFPAYIKSFFLNGKSIILCKGKKRGHELSTRGTLFIFVGKVRRVLNPKAKTEVKPDQKLKVQRQGDPY
jgi:hypothetical protein